MSSISSLPLLLGADNRLVKVDWAGMASGLGLSSFAIQALIVLAIIALCFGAGILFANSARIKDYGWKIGLILSVFFVSLFVVVFGRYKLGVDLQGGVILVYEVDEVETASLNAEGRSDQWNMNQLVKVIGERLNPDGLKEIVVRPFGPKQVEIVVPEADPEEIKKLKELIITGGALQFMIVASDLRDSQLFELAREEAARTDERKLDREVLDEEGRRVGYWATVGRESGGPDKPFREPSVVAGLIRDRRTGDIIDLSTEQQNLFLANPAAFQAYLDARGINEIDALMVYSAEYHITGEDLANPRAGRDQYLRPCILFGTRGEGIWKMSNLTHENLQRKLAIIFDNRLLSAPVIQSRISDNGEITGQFTQEEVDFIVGILRSGSMPVVLHKNPISENTIGSILGRETIEAGSWSVVAALGVVFLFMMVYYRFAGMVAGTVLAMNLMMTVAIMVILQAPFTLPGLAGLVLTVAMSVDANVLIAERMREELGRGASLRMAIRNGFDKALSAIIDGNVTTFLTALVLYTIGTDQIRGFGMTLMLGNVTSVFTAIFCARVILEVGEKTRAIKSLSMTNFLTNPKVDWVKYFGPAVGLSLVLFIIGVVATVARGRGLFDTDLAGGTSVTFILKEPVADDQVVRDKIDAVLSKVEHPVTKGAVDFSVNEVNVRTEKPKTVYKVDSSLPEVEDLQNYLREAFRTADGHEGLKTFQVTVSGLKESAVAPSSPPTIGSAGPAGPKGQAPAGQGKKNPESTTEAPERAPDAKAKPAEPAGDKPVEDANPADEKPAEAKPAEKAKPAEDNSPNEKPADEKPADEAKPDSSGCQEEPAEKEPKTAEPVEDKPAAEKPAETKPGEDKPAVEQPAEAKPAEATPAPEATTPPKATTPPAPTTPPAATTPPEATTPPTGTASPGGTSPQAAPPTRSMVQTTATLDFPQSAITAEALLTRIGESSLAAINEHPAATVNNPNWDGHDNSAFNTWEVSLPLPKEKAQKVLDHLQSSLEGDVIWQTSSKFGGQVSEDTRWKALTALIVSLLGVVAYVWFRFQKVAWGLAAVAALAHDALSMLTAIAISYWIAGPLGFLGVEEFKISLPVVAAFLTILGYSVNDTIVIFDRLREIRGKSPDVTRQMLNDAVNQTLGRTIILAGITLTVTIILYAFGGPGIHAFAFALLIGVASGLYTTLVIAAPLLYWLLGANKAAARSVEGREVAKSHAKAG